jgi:hypothetical protein
MPKIKSKKAEEILKPLDDLIKDVQKHTDDGVDCLERARKEIAKNIEEHLSDTKKRIRFFTDWHNKSAHDLGVVYPKLCDDFMTQKTGYFINYIPWLFNFCFSEPDRPFDKILQEKRKECR